MADPLSIAASCVGLLSAIATATVRINGFVRTARDARPDLNAVSRELSSLRTVLELIQADAEESQNQLPESIINHLCEVLTNCNGAVADIEKILKKYEKNDAMTSGRWAMSGKGDVEKLRTHLEAHTSALSLVLNMMNLVVSIKVRHDTVAIHNQTTDIKLDTANILIKIEELQARLPSKGTQERDDYMLQRYLEEMTTYTEEVLSSVERESEPNGKNVDDEEAALERFLDDNEESSRPTSDTVLTPSVSVSEEIVAPQEPPTRQPPIPDYLLFRGHLILDIPIPEAALSKIPHGMRDEFTHARYTAVTCDPQFMKGEGYSLRASLFAKPRTTDILISIFYEGTGASLFDVLSGVWDAVDGLYKELDGSRTVDEARWKRVILHIHFSRTPMGLTERLLDEISARPLDQTEGRSKFTEKSLVNGESVLWHMYEYTTQLRLKRCPVRSTTNTPSHFAINFKAGGSSIAAPLEYTTFRGRNPLQTIVTHSSDKRRPESAWPRVSWQAWRGYLRMKLAARVTVWGPSGDVPGFLRPWTLAKAWHNGKDAKPPGKQGNYEVQLSELWEWSDRWNVIKAIVST